jgi:hypothetical protein
MLDLSDREPRGGAMKALVVYESMFGNTKQVAEAVADGLRATYDTGVIEVGGAPSMVSDVDLLVVGGPTHALGMSRPQTRESAIGYTDEPLVSPGQGIREWLGGLAKSTGTPAAVFDTKVDKPWVPGSASGAAARRLRKLGFQLALHPASFLVDGITGPIGDGELARARRWGEQLATKLSKRHGAGV